MELAIYILGFGIMFIFLYFMIVDTSAKEN